MLADELKKMAELRDAGILTDAEFQKKKAELLSGSLSAPLAPIDHEIDERYASFYCSSDQKMVFGLCGGLAHKFGVPPAAMRLLIFISLWFVVGWLYIVGLFLPKLPTKNVRRPR